MHDQKDKSPRDKFRDVLYGKPDMDIPFIIWNNKLPSARIECELLQKGACIVVNTAFSLCTQAGDTGRVMIGICENIPRTEHMTMLADTVGKYNS